MSLQHFYFKYYARSRSKRFIIIHYTSSRYVYMIYVFNTGSGQKQNRSDLYYRSSKTKKSCGYFYKDLY